MKEESKQPPSPSSFLPPRATHRLLKYAMLCIAVTYILYTLMLILLSIPKSATIAISSRPKPTSLTHIVFGIASSAKLWGKRKSYVKLWWRPGLLRGVVWLDRPVAISKREVSSMPSIRISGNTSRFRYTNKRGRRSAIRISRIVAETFRLGLSDVRWFVMGDDDTVFLPENLLAVLSRLDHREFYYIGSQSESHLQNIFFSHGMAYGGGGFAISYPLAAALSKMQDRCIQRYPELYGSDDRIQACMAELGVQVTHHSGFHQYDIHGNLFGLLAAHPVAPLVSLHHLDVVTPVFPNETRAAGLRRLFDGPVRLDSSATMQQSICYDREKMWTISVSWGFAVQIVSGILSPREMEKPLRTFLNWHRKADYTGYAFNTRPVARTPCLRPFVFYLQLARIDAKKTNRTVTHYGPRRLLDGGGSNGDCNWTDKAPTMIEKVVVSKPIQSSMWKGGLNRVSEV